MFSNQNRSSDSLAGRRTLLGSGLSSAATMLASKSTRIAGGRSRPNMSIIYLPAAFDATIGQTESVLAFDSLYNKGMCRHYAFRANEPTKVECTLVRAQNALLAQSRADRRGKTHS